MMKEHLLEIRRNAEGDKLAYLLPLDVDGKPKCGYRISGPKAWGGSVNLARIKIREDDLVSYIKSYAPEIITKLGEDS